MKLRLFTLLLMPIFTLSATLQDYEFGAFELLDPTEKKPVRTAVLIVWRHC